MANVDILATLLLLSMRNKKSIKSGYLLTILIKMWEERL